MDLLKDLFKKFPLVYHIGDEYYAFGHGVCSIVTNETYIERYKRNMRNMDASESAEDVARYIQNIIQIAEYSKESSIDVLTLEDCIKRFNTYKFSEEELCKLKQQMDDYTDIFRNSKVRKTLII